MPYFNIFVDIFSGVVIDYILTLCCITAPQQLSLVVFQGGIAVIFCILCWRLVKFRHVYRRVAKMYKFGLVNFCDYFKSVIHNGRSSCLILYCLKINIQVLIYKSILKISGKSESLSIKSQDQRICTLVIGEQPFDYLWYNQ